MDGIPSDPDCIHVDTRHIPENVVSPLYENFHILWLYTQFQGADYYGTTSWRLFEKTGLTKKDIDAFINANPANAYVYYQCNEHQKKEGLVWNIRQKTDIGNAVKRIIDLRVFKTPNVQEKWVPVYANFFIADKPTWDRYMPYLTKVLRLTQTDLMLKRLLSKTFGFRGRPFPLTCFVLEYLFGLFLADNLDIVWKEIPGIPYPKPLAEIYKNHKGPFGYGDKGTAHRYIQTYDKLFTQFRNKPITILEIGVYHGHSLRMWREFFPKARVIGIDLNRPGKEIPGCEFYQCNQTDAPSLGRIFDNTTFDIIIDDGSHVLEHQLESFKILWDKMNTQGLYIIEDVGGASRKPDDDIQALKQLGPCDVYDTRQQSKQYDDILMVWTK